MKLFSRVGEPTRGVKESTPKVVDELPKKKTRKKKAKKVTIEA